MEPVYAAAALAAFLASAHPGQVYMGDNAVVHPDTGANIRPGDHCYTGGEFKDQCWGPNTYRVTIESVNRKAQSFTYTSTVKMRSGSWKFSMVHQMSSLQTLCDAVADNDLIKDPRKGRLAVETHR